jgi:hypothetical protein
MSGGLNLIADTFFLPRHLLPTYAEAIQEDASERRLRGIKDVGW